MLRNGKYVVPLTLTNSSPSGCFDPDNLETIIRNNGIVGNYRNDPPPNFVQLIGAEHNGIDTIYAPVQDKTFYEVATQIENQPSTLGETCYFDTRICTIDIIGSQQSSGSCATDDVGDGNYTEARNLMNPNISRLMQPFDDWHTRCDSTAGVIVPSFTKGTTYYDLADRRWKLIDECYSPGERDVVLFDPPAGSLPSGALNTVILNSNVSEATHPNPDPLNLPAGSDFVLEDTALSLVVKGSNVRIDDNLVYPSSRDASFGIIALENDSGLGADIFIRPEPTNIVGALYAEGSVQTVTQGNMYPTDRNFTTWFADLANQLYLEGSIISRNTIGGAVDPTDYGSGVYPWPRSDQSWCPSATTDTLYSCSWQEAVQYDIAHLREHHHFRNNPADTAYPAWNPSSAYFTVIGAVVEGGIAAVDVPSEAAVVVRYDSRIQGNPPPGFEGVGGILQGELGL